MLARAPGPEASPPQPTIGEPDAVLGFYGPDSQMWRINREAVLLGAGPAALLLQIAHPLVAEGVAAHSAFEADPFARLRRTLRTTLGLVFGDGPTARRSVARLNGIHQRVQGEVQDPGARAATGRSHYAALDPELLLWVQATLLLTSARAYATWVGPISPADREAFWQEARAVGVWLGIPLAVSPPSWPELEAWFEAQLAPDGPVRVTDTARAMAPTIIRPPLPACPAGLVALATLPGLGLLPPRVRADFGIAWSRRHQLAADALGLGLRWWVRSLPRSWRATPPARAAESRARHQHRPRRGRRARARSRATSATIPAVTR
jgi:uncharacterized protein (DUF2236 family)